MKATNPDFVGGDEDDLSGDDQLEGSEGWSDVDDDDDDSDAEGQPDEGSSDTDDLSFAEGSDAEDLIDLDDEVPEELLEYPGSDSDVDDEVSGADEEWAVFGDAADDANTKKRKRGAAKDDGKQKKKKLRSLPTFASYEDYAKMIEEGPEDDV